MPTKKPVILITLYRRYVELQHNLQRFQEIKHEFAEPPDVVLVWAQPELGRLWFIEELQAEGKIQHVLGREREPDETSQVATSYPESMNIRKGLEFIRKTYGDNSYCLMQAADIWPREGIYGMVDSHMQKEDMNAVIFHWQNGIIHSGIWHTNFFAVSMDDRYWPPLSKPGHADVLERHWGSELAKKALPGIFQTHNYQCKKFLHTHETETSEPWPIFPRTDGQCICVYVRGWKPWRLRLKEWFQGVLARWR